MRDLPASALNPDDPWNVVQLLHRYADAYDRKDIGLLRLCYNDAAVFRSVTPSGHERIFTGIDEIIANASNTFRAVSATRRHQMTNELVHVNGDTAHVSSYLTLLETTGDGVSVLLTGRYVDMLTRRPDDSWRIQSRVLHSDAEFTIPTVPARP